MEIKRNDKKHIPLRRKAERGEKMGKEKMEHEENQCVGNCITYKWSKNNDSKGEIIRLGP